MVRIYFSNYYILVLFFMVKVDILVFKKDYDYFDEQVKKDDGRFVERGGHGWFG